MINQRGFSLIETLIGTMILGFVGAVFAQTMTWFSHHMSMMKAKSGTQALMLELRSRLNVSSVCNSSLVEKNDFDDDLSTKEISIRMGPNVVIAKNSKVLDHHVTVDSLAMRNIQVVRSLGKGYKLFTSAIYMRVKSTAENVSMAERALGPLNFVAKGSKIVSCGNDASTPQIPRELDEDEDMNNLRICRTGFSQWGGSGNCCANQHKTISCFQESKWQSASNGTDGVMVGTGTELKASTCLCRIKDNDDD